MRVAAGFVLGVTAVSLLWRKAERKRRLLDEKVSDFAPGLVLQGGLRLLDVVTEHAEAVPVEVAVEAADFRSVVNEHVTS